MVSRTMGPQSAWPPKADPGKSPVHARNVILIAADPTTIWSVLIRAPQWPEWYPYSADVRILPDGEELGLGVRFHWRTFDVAVRSQVEEWQPYQRIAWNAKAIFTSAYHRWTIFERDANGFTQVVTEETQRGLVPTLLRFFLMPQLRRQHRTWLQRLKCLSEDFS